MGKNAEFLIPFKGLENGIHNYRFQVSTDFFKKFENSRIKKGDYQIDLILDKRGQMMILDFTFQGSYNADCDRCLASINIDNQGEDRVIVKYANSQSSNEEEVIVLEEDAFEINVAPLIHNMVHLHLPLINERDCENEDYKYCDHTILDRIDGHTKDDDDNEESSTWDALKDLNLD